MSLRELVQGQQNHRLIDGRLLFICQQPGHRGDPGAAIAVLPHKRGRLIQTVGFVPLQVINQNLIV
jgi:hypothetical protein